MTSSDDNEWLSFYKSMQTNKLFTSVYLLDGPQKLGKNDINWSELSNDILIITNKYLHVNTIVDECEFRTYVEITDGEKNGALMVKYEDVRFVAVYKEKERVLAQKVVYDYFKNAGEEE